eukprot:CAMPEP_0198654366 /NCGR_PEP_ID=MMETSP1467-20131203/7664_1 /TAXON_ID=1462469 /ORGANISM="unid. sp., Strain CCMP2135" /LENGTH=205 /DNA_ID=CAMNT_0044390351 /DNA_START=29 /DNA_END=646 /DNA_ORIENTATION=-
MKKTFATLVLGVGAAVVAVALGPFGSCKEGEATAATEEIRTYQSAYPVSIFPYVPMDGKATFFDVVYVIKGTFQPKSFGTLRVVSYFEPFASGICEQVPGLVYQLAHAEVAFSSNMVMSTLEVTPTTEEARKTTAYQNITNVILTGVAYDTKTDSFENTVAQLRVYDGDPLRPKYNDASVTGIQSHLPLKRVPNYEQCPDVGLNP